MPKLKSHSGAKKRLKFTATGKVKRAHAYKSHLLNTQHKSHKRKRNLRKEAYVDSANLHSVRKLLPYE